MKRFSIKRLFLIFLVIIVTVITVIISLTVGPKTWEAIKQINMIYIASALVLGIIWMILDGLVVKVLAAAIGANIDLLYCFKAVLFLHFLSSVTPTVSGGEPLMIYMLTKRGITGGKAATIILIRGIFILSIIALAAPIIIYFHGELIKNVLLKRIFYYIAILLSFIILIIIYNMLNPIRGDEVINYIFGWLKHIRIIGDYGERFKTRVKQWISDFRNSLGEFLRHKKSILIIMLLLMVASQSANFSIAYVILKGLNRHLSLFHVFMIQIVLYFLLYFIPTPGGTGVAEGGAYVMFASEIPSHLLGVFIIIWRFFTTYLWVILGGILVTRSIGIETLDGISGPD